MQSAFLRLVGSGVESPAAVTLLSNRELRIELAYEKRLQYEIDENTYLDTLALRQANPRLLMTNDEDVGLASSEGVVNSVLDVDNAETTIVTLTVSDGTNTTHVTTTSNHNDGTSIELDEVLDLASGEIDLDSVVDLDLRVGVADTIEMAHADVSIYGTTFMKR